jgi:outer membrane protein assembly complex protein YaeT
MRLLGGLLAVSCLLPSAAVRAQTAGAPAVVEVRVEQEGQVVADRLINGLIATRVGEPLSMRSVRETTTHLMSLGRFEDVQSFQEPVPGGIRLRYVLVPLHPVDRVEFRGATGLSDGDLRRVLTERYGLAPSASRVEEAVEFLHQAYESRGYPKAQIAPHIEETHNPDRATLVFDIDAGPRAIIERVEFDQLDPIDDKTFLAQPAVRKGQPYDAEAIIRELQRYEDNLRARSYYAARAVHTVEFAPNGTAAVMIAVDRGPRVSVAFAGDPLPEADRERLVPVRLEGSADEDLLEDASRAIEEYLHARGYNDAFADYSRDERDGELTITYSVKRGRRHVVEAVRLNGNMAVTDAELLQLVRLKPGEPFVQATLDGGIAAIRNVYRARGFTRAMVEGVRAELPDGNNVDAADDQRVDVAVNVVEGPRTLVDSVAFEGNTVFTEDQLRALVTTAPNRAFSAVEVASDRDRIDLEYRNRGYESVAIDPGAALSDNDTRANVRFAISEGPQVIVDHVIIVGNERTSAETIERELLLRPGEPLGYAARIESQQRLAALGLFRSVRIEELPHAGEPRRDVLVQVEEAPPTTIGYGGGVEGGTRLRPTGEGGQAEERFEIAPRGFFEVGRRNMWGKNRSVNLFTRVSLRARDVVFSDSGIRFDEPTGDSSYGFNEYRVVGQYREPRIFNTAADALATGILDQAIRSSFNFIRRQARGEIGLRLSTRYSITGFYSFEHNELFDEKFPPEEQVPIDRLFPQVRLSKFSGSVLRDSRTDLVDADGGSLLVATTDFAGRAFGSEVGFVKTYLQAFSYHRLPSARRIVLALGARVGAARGFTRAVTRVGDDGNPIPGADGEPIVDVVRDLPASERFFAGGDTTVRGFSLDRLGTPETITPSGFPTGGNGVIVLNAELRVNVFGAGDAVLFTDAGNVFPRASDLDFTNLRPAAGFGVHYRSPIGPIRVELGFNLDRRELVPGTLERGSVLHISLGRAF